VSSRSAGSADGVALAEDDIEVGEVRRRAVTGSAILALRGVAIRILALGGNVVLARLLVPHDFGLVAFGTAAMQVGTFLTAAGLGAALIRRETAPTRRELGALLGLQLAGTSLLCAVVAAAVWPLGTGGQVVALMLAGMPLLVFRTPGAIMFERSLSYRPLVAVEVGETLAFYAFAIPAAALGMGVWAMAAGYVVRAFTGSVVMLTISPLGFVRPRLAFQEIRALLGFGLKFEAVGLVSIVYQQALAFGAALIGGVSALGIWALAKRILDVPVVLFESLWRVSYPAMSRLLAAGERAAPTIERGAALASVLTGVIVLGLVGPGPQLVSLVFGGPWDDAAWIIPGGALGLLISAPVSVAAAGYLYGVGDAGTVLRSAIFTSLAWLAVLFALLPVIGVGAFGLGALAGGIVDVTILGRATARHSGASFRGLVVPTVAAVAAGTAGWLCAAAAGDGWGAAALGFVVAETAFAAALWLVRPDLLADVLRLGRRGFAEALRRDRTPATATPDTPRARKYARRAVV
jgi:O-antigen/teichoic acid export membrane protein